MAVVIGAILGLGIFTYVCVLLLEDASAVELTDKEES
jgi:hypothetical protein